MDDDQQFCLRWNNHQSTLVAVFDTLLENGTLVDCTLAAEGKCLNAHKVVLSACSPFFESLLSRHYDKHPILILKDVKFQELKAMMDYMYRGEVNISQDQLGALLKAAESLQIKGLSDNRKGGETDRKAAPQPPAPSKSPQPTSLPKVQGLTIEQRSRDDSREGSQSPGPRKKKRIRRKSEELDNHHDASNSSESHSNQTPAQNIPTMLPASKIIADVPEPVETKSEILTRHKQSDDVPQVPIIKEKIETHTELMLEPKSEYVDEMNEDSIEDLTLDDDDISNMESMDDGAGPSHGNAGEGSSQGCLLDWNILPFLCIQKVCRQLGFLERRQMLFGGIKELVVLDKRRRHSNPPDNICPPRDLIWAEFEIEPLATMLEGSIRKYSRQSVKLALDAILNRGETVTQASIDFGIKRTSLQHYLKKLNIKIKSNV
ncbi:BTB domain containing protein [Asbolus verrucosus]|uniref:BTB domain containing protein n=1 Tax=Asbolus verrucosus TaxID=1661398 RepID=A0A482V7M8_ASBVE|nr:BTB domain containing protein [Asbolus verrucosus]